VTQNSPLPSCSISSNSSKYRDVSISSFSSNRGIFGRRWRFRLPEASFKNGFLLQGGSVRRLRRPGAFGGNVPDPWFIMFSLFIGFKCVWRKNAFDDLRGWWWLRSLSSSRWTSSSWLAPGVDPDIPMLPKPNPSLLFSSIIRLPLLGLPDGPLKKSSLFRLPPEAFIRLPPSVAASAACRRSSSPWGLKQLCRLFFFGNGDGERSTFCGIAGWSCGVHNAYPPSSWLY